MQLVGARAALVADAFGQYYGGRGTAVVSSRYGNGGRHGGARHGEIGGYVEQLRSALVGHPDGLHQRGRVAAGIGGGPGAQQGVRSSASRSTIGNTVLYEGDEGRGIAGVGSCRCSHERQGGAAHVERRRLIDSQQRRGIVDHRDNLGSRRAIPAGVGRRPGAAQRISVRTSYSFARLGELHRRYRVAVIFGRDHGRRRHGGTAHGHIGGHAEQLRIGAVDDQQGLG